MHISVRSHLIAGVAFVGIGALALMPVAPAAPAVELRAVVNENTDVYVKYRDPVKVWVETVEESAYSTITIGKSYFAEPAPVLKEVVKSQITSAYEVVRSVELAVGEAVPAIAEVPEALLTALAQLARGDVQGAAVTLLDPVFTLGVAVLKPGAAVIEAVKAAVADLSAVVGVLTDPDTVRAVVLAVTGPILSAVNALVDSAEMAVGGFAGGDLKAVVNALVNLPADLTGAILNGHGTGLGGVKAVGLLTPYDPEAEVAGPLAVVQVIREAIGEAIAGTPNGNEQEEEPEPEVPIDPADPTDPEVPIDPEDPTDPVDPDDTVVIDDGTVVIDDGGVKDPVVTDPGDDDGYVVIIIDDEDDHTTVVDDEGEHTVVIGDKDDYTVVIDEEDDYTVVIDEEDDYTVVIGDEETEVEVGSGDTYVTVKDSDIENYETVVVAENDSATTSESSSAGVGAKRVASAKSAKSAGSGRSAD